MENNYERLRILNLFSEALLGCEPDKLPGCSTAQRAAIEKIKKIVESEFGSNIG